MNEQPIKSVHIEKEKNRTITKFNNWLQLLERVPKSFKKVKCSYFNIFYAWKA